MSFTEYSHLVIYILILFFTKKKKNEICFLKIYIFYTQGRGVIYPFRELHYDKLLFSKKNIRFHYLIMFEYMSYKK